MRVLMLGWELPPHYVGGMGIVCDQLTRQMAKDGVDIEFILPFYADYSHIKHMKVTAALDQNAETLMRSGGNLRFHLLMKFACPAAKSLTVPLHEQVEAFAANVGRLVQYGTYDVIHAHDWLTMRAGIAAKKATGLPAVCAHPRHGNLTAPVATLATHWLEKLNTLAHMADHILRVSGRTKQTLIDEYGIPPEDYGGRKRHEHIAGADCRGARQLPYLEAMRRIGYKVVVNAGRMTIQKGIMQLLEAARLFVDKRPKTLFC